MGKRNRETIEYASCFFCEKMVEFLEFHCFGCDEVVCERCDEITQFGTHEVEEHQSDPSTIRAGSL